MTEETSEQPTSPEQPPQEKPVEPQVEAPPTPEAKEAEAKITGKEKVEPVPKTVKKPPPTAPPKVVPDLVKKKSATLKEIEGILSEGLEQTYQSLPDDLKQEFRQKGEETASQIEKIVSQAKIIVHKIVDLIKKWLLIIPGVNKFFLEQEIKLKTGKILALAKKKKT
ncbi:hypothetical protein ISS21_01965 [Patescibacteria group bacterium]|nr:hypothetical protein [Patescibacteria group bacterium]